MTGSPILSTTRPGLVLKRLTSDHASAIHELVQHNRAHLTAHGDFSELVAATMDALSAELARRSDRQWRFGVFLDGALVGRADLIGVAPPKYSIGYWLAKSATGQGFATLAVERLLGFAFEDLNATNVFAGVSHGNERSEALLSRLGFESVERFETYTRFHLRASQADRERCAPSEGNSN